MPEIPELKGLIAESQVSVACKEWGPTQYETLLQNKEHAKDE